ncbi:MAG: hypothetical protein MJ181_11645 [Treponema sp.]|nr:hypothetical protein [Treponema sp.]
MKCTECEMCPLEGGNGSCEIQDFEMNIECQAEYKPKSDKEDIKDEK